MTIFTIAGITYVLHRATRTITRDTNRTRAINNALYKTVLYK